MGKQYIKQQWMCGACEQIYDYEEDARECCPPGVWEVWCCPNCGEWHESEDDAKYCCGWEDSEESDDQVNREELEQLGQQRLKGF